MSSNDNATSSEKVQVLIGPDDLLGEVTDDIMITEGKDICETFDGEGNISFNSETS